MSLFLFFSLSFALITLRLSVINLNVRQDIAPKIPRLGTNLWHNKTSKTQAWALMECEYVRSGTTIAVAVQSASTIQFDVRVRLL